MPADEYFGIGVGMFGAKPSPRAVQLVGGPLNRWIIHDFTGISFTDGNSEYIAYSSESPYAVYQAPDASGYKDVIIAAAAVALPVVNVIRSAVGLEPATALPDSTPGCVDHCPVAEAIAGTAKVSGSLVFHSADHGHRVSAALNEDLESYTSSIKTPPALTLFISVFDQLRPRLSIFPTGSIE